MSLKELESNRERILRFLYENETIDTLGINLLDIGKQLGITNNLKEAAMSLVHDGLAEFTATGDMIKITYPGLELVESILSTNETVRENKRRRERFLNTLYQRHQSNNINMQIEELSRELGFDDTLTRNILRYFIHKRYVEQQSLGGPIKITYEGIKEIERNLTNF